MWRRLRSSTIWREVAFLRRQRMDMVLSVSGLFVMLVAIQVAAAGALSPAGLKLERVKDLIPIFSLVLGDAGRIVLAAGLWSATFNYHVGGSAGHSLMLADSYHRHLRPSAVIAEQDTGRGAALLPAYRWFLVYFCLAPLYVLLTDWAPIWLVLINSASNVVLLPIVIVAVMRLTAAKSTLGKYANGWFVNTAMVLALAAALWLAGQGGAELIARLKGRSQPPHGARWNRTESGMTLTSWNGRFHCNVKLKLPPTAYCSMRIG